MPTSKKEYFVELGEKDLNILRTGGTARVFLDSYWVNITASEPAQKMILAEAESHEDRFVTKKE